MWVRIIFWLTLLVWFADILQPGYLQLYDWRNAVELLQKLQFPPLVIAPSTFGPTSIPKRQSPQAKKAAHRGSSGSPECQVARNDFEEILSTANVGCWQATPSNTSGR